MAWSTEEQEAYGAELIEGADEERLRQIVLAWLGSNQGIDPIQMIQWMRDTIDFDPFLLFDEEGGMWLQSALYGTDIGDESPLSTALFMGLDAGP